MSAMCPSFPAIVLFLSLIAASAVAAGEPARTVSLVVDPNAGRPALHGVEKLQGALRARGWDVEQVARLEGAHGDHLVLVGHVAVPAAVTQGEVPAQKLDRPEALSIRTFTWQGKPAVLLAGADDRGLMYALLDAADRVSWGRPASESDADPFAEVRDAAESPVVRDRSLSVYTMNRAYWESRFYDEAYWTRYFDLLAADRFNRFLVIFGYENGGFLAPPYPYFFNTPGFPDVHMVDLTPEQQHRNLDALNRLIELAHDRGIAVSLGIWDHIYRGAVQTGGAEWLGRYQGQPVPNTVAGVTTENLNAYTLASLKELLARVPALDGLQFRIHEESGLKREEMDGFWREVFQHVQKERPGLLIEARGKGTPDSVIESALALGVNLRIETKYWMEQMGLPFHPTHINPQDQHNRRHGYADFLRYPQRYRMNWRLWNGGTTRVLLWGDPDYVRRYSASTALYDSRNWDVQEPLATKMEAQPPDLPVFDLMPAKYRYTDYEFERYWHFYQLWGRLGYNPDTPTEVWDHEFNRRFGAAAGPHMAAALHRASHVLPMLVACSCYPYSAFPTTRGWAERQSLGATLESYARNTGTDTAQFESFADAARRILAGGTTARRTPETTSRWLATTAASILDEVRSAESAIGDQRGREFDSTITDLKILAQLARFHAHRSLAAVHYNLFLQGKRPAELVAATRAERDAVAEWQKLVDDVGDRYAFDLAMGARDYDLCGHWRDELVKLEADLRSLEARCGPVDRQPGDAEAVWQPDTTGGHASPIVTNARIATAKPGLPLRIVARVADAAGVKSVTLRYRHVTQFEDYVALEMVPTGVPDEFAATVPGRLSGPGMGFHVLPRDHRRIRSRRDLAGPRPRSALRVRASRPRPLNRPWVQARPVLCGLVRRPDHQVRRCA